MDQLRILGIDIRNRPATIGSTVTTAVANEIAAGTSAASTAPAATAAATSSIQINPEFLAALPQQIQEEVSLKNDCV